jgi:c-di-GMP-binding flagellar brake protein YcgR
MATDDSALSREEIDYLRNLFREARPAPGQHSGGRRMRLDASGTDAELLAQLLDSHRLSLTAERDGLLIRFELTLHQPQSGEPLEVSFGQPAITEQQHERERAVRVHPNDSEVTVQDADGHPLPVRVRDLSATGMALAARDETAAPGARIRLRLRLEGSGETLVEGRVVRVEEATGSDECTLGVAFEHTDQATRSLLEQFVSRKHTDTPR